MIKSSRLEKEEKIENNIIKDIKSFFNTKKEAINTTIKDIKEIFLD